MPCLVDREEEGVWTGLCNRSAVSMWLHASRKMHLYRSSEPGRGGGVEVELSRGRLMWSRSPWTLLYFFSKSLASLLALYIAAPAGATTLSVPSRFRTRGDRWRDCGEHYGSKCGRVPFSTSAEPRPRCPGDEILSVMCSAVNRSPTRTSANLAFKVDRRRAG